MMDKIMIMEIMDDDGLEHKSSLCACVHLQKVVGHYSLRNLWETLLEVLQDVVVELRASMRHPQRTQSTSPKP